MDFYRFGGRGKFPGLNEAKVGSNKKAGSLSPANTELRGEELCPTKGDPIGAEQYGSKLEGR